MNNCCKKQFTFTFICFRLKSFFVKCQEHVVVVVVVDDDVVDVVVFDVVDVVVAVVDVVVVVVVLNVPEYDLFIVKIYSMIWSFCLCHLL